jgi:tRNA(Ile2) C34 agmatinyltransferase TiaS
MLTSLIDYRENRCPNCGGSMIDADLAQVLCSECESREEEKGDREFDLKRELE